MLEFTLDRRSPVPLYYQLSQQLEDAIRTGAIKAGERIDTEVDISERYGLSRPTVRQAIQDLVNKGLLVRRRGVGTQVVHNQTRRQVELTSLYDDLAASDQQPTTHVMQLRTEPATAEVAAGLNITEGEPVLHFERVRFVAGEPLAIIRNWLPADLINLTVESLENTGFYELLRRESIQIRIANQRIGARAATPSESKLLGIRSGAPVLTMDRQSFDDTGRAIELANSVYRSDIYAFETTLVER